MENDFIHYSKNCIELLRESSDVKVRAKISSVSRVLYLPPVVHYPPQRKLAAGLCKPSVRNSLVVRELLRQHCRLDS
jgi:hypothetical protein